MKTHVLQRTTFYKAKMIFHRAFNPSNGILYYENEGFIYS